MSNIHEIFYRDLTEAAKQELLNFLDIAEPEGNFENTPLFIYEKEPPEVSS